MARDLHLKYKGNESTQIWNIDVGLRRDQRLPELAAPPGFSSDRERSVVNDVKQAQEENHNNLVDKRSWDIALGPVKSLPMNMFIMYMAGNHISIFPIMMVGMMFFRPIQALMGIRSTMRMLECSNQYVLQTVMYVFGNCLCLMLAVYKCNSMGLLPTHPSDWLAFVEPPQRLEFVTGGIRL